jgi:hypothetical protein
VIKTHAKLNGATLPIIPRELLPKFIPNFSTRERRAGDIEVRKKRISLDLLRKSQPLQAPATNE